MIGRNGVPQLLEGLFRRRMSRHIAMQNTAASDLPGHEHEQNPETRGHYHQKIAGYDALSMIADKGLPRLGRGSPASAAHPRLLRPIFADRSRGNIYAEF
jgi:hypothetical protein